MECGSHGDYNASAMRKINRPPWGRFCRKTTEKYRLGIPWWMWRVVYKGSSERRQGREWITRLFLKDIPMVPPIKTTDLVPFLTKAQWTFISAVPFGFLANQTRWHTKTLKGSHRRGGGLIFLKTSAPHSLMMTYRMNIISAGSISLDSTFKFQLPEDGNSF